MTVTGPPPGTVWMADHPLILAVPAFVPALIIAGVVGFIVVRDRRAERAKNEEAAAQDDLAAANDREEGRGRPGKPDEGDS